MPTQQYYNGAYMEETVHDIITKIRQRNKSMTTTDKNEVEGSLNLKASRNKIMYTFFYSGIYYFAGNFQVMLDE